MNLYRVATRLCMVLHVKDDFSFDKKNEIDAANTKVQKWESLMDKYQQRLPFAQDNEKWVLMEQIFHFST